MRVKLPVPDAVSVRETLELPVGVEVSGGLEVGDQVRVLLIV